MMLQISVSCCEIYNETIRDLFSERKRDAKLSVRFDRSRDACSIGNLTELPVRHVEDVMRWLTRALHKRKSGANSINDRSSRSHCIITLHFQSMVKGQRRSDVR